MFRWGAAVGLLLRVCDATSAFWLTELFSCSSLADKSAFPRLTDVLGILAGATDATVDCGAAEALDARSGAFSALEEGAPLPVASCTTVDLAVLYEAGFALDAVALALFRGLDTATDFAAEAAFEDAALKVEVVSVRVDEVVAIPTEVTAELLIR